MARNEADHEDLMREAVSLVRRIECRYASRHEPSLVGFNALGWLFIYLGTDRMYRFDAQGRLRRAFVDGKLFRTNGDTLAMMVRQRSLESTEVNVKSETTLLRRDLSPLELEAFRVRMRLELAELIQGLGTGAVTRQHPADANGLVDEIQAGIGLVLASEKFLAPAIVRR